MPRWRFSATRATCCAPPPASLPNARIELIHTMTEPGRDLDQLLARFRKMPAAYRIVYARPRTFIALAIGIAAVLLLPHSLRLVTRLLIGWDVFIGFYLLLVYGMMFRSSERSIRRNAALQDDGSFVILLVAALGA